MSLLPDTFFELAPKLYRNDALWLAESPDNIRAHWRDAQESLPGLQIYLDVDVGDARLVGSMAPEQTFNEKPTAYFGYWEAIDDVPVNQRLFRSFEEWARGQGAEQVLGPIDLGLLCSHGLRLNAFGDGAFPGEPYNPDYYPRLMAQLGYAQAKAFASSFGALRGRADLWLPRLQPELQRLENAGWRFQGLSAEDWMEQLDDVYNQFPELLSWDGASPKLSPSAFQRIYGVALAQRLCPLTSIRVLDPKGRLAAFLLSVPDYGPLMQQGQFRPVTPAALRFTEHYPLLKQPRLLLKHIGVHSRYRAQDNTGAPLDLFALMACLSLSRAEPNYHSAAITMLAADHPLRQVADAFFSRAGDWRHDYGWFGKLL